MNIYTFHSNLCQSERESKKETESILCFISPVIAPVRLRIFLMATARGQRLQWGGRVKHTCNFLSQQDCGQRAKVLIL